MTDTQEIKPEEEPLTTEKKEGENKRGFIQKLKHLKSSITVEPMLAGLVIPSILAKLAVTNLNLDKACRVKNNFGDEICNALLERNGNSSYEADVQRIISDIESWKSIILTAVPIMPIICTGAWSDRTGNRKLLILLPLVGQFLLCVSNILSTYFFYNVSVEVTMFLEALFPAATGGYLMLCSGVFSYISDITDEESRTFRVGLVHLCMTAGVPIGSALSGILLKLLGYYGIFTISGSVYMITFLYGFFYLKSNTKPNADVFEKPKPITCCEVAMLVKETGEVATKKRESNFRKKIILTLLVVAVAYGPVHAERIIMYMYVRYRLKWNAFNFSIYSIYNIIAHSCGVLFSISVFSKRLGFHDSVLCLISITSKLAGSVLIAFVQTDFQMFMVPIIEILEATTFTSLRSMVSKLVPSEELGKMNSLFSLVETLAALMFDPTYSAIYSRTVSGFTGAVFMFSAVMTLPAISVLLWLFIQNRKEIKQKRLQTKNTKEII